jgi:tetraacyldisaccharide 4'-kinase
MTLEPGPIRSLVDPARTADPAHFAAGRNVAVAGIGNPSRFFATLAALGVRAEPRAFPDHHPYTREDVAFPDAEAILMTEKDAVKCRDFADDRFWVVPVGARVEPPLLPLLEKTLHGP